MNPANKRLPKSIYLTATLINHCLVFGMNSLELPSNSLEYQWNTGIPSRELRSDIPSSFTRVSSTQSDYCILPDQRSEALHANNVQITKTKAFRYGQNDSLHFSCSSGYQLADGESSVICQRTNGKLNWSGTIPNCKRRICPWQTDEKTSAVEFRYNERIITDQSNLYPQGTEAVYYNLHSIFFEEFPQLNGKSLKRRCNNNRTWSDLIGDTNGTFCALPVSPYHLDMVVLSPSNSSSENAQGFAPDDRATRLHLAYKNSVAFFRCSFFGFTLIGASRLQCDADNANGKAGWNGKIPECKKNACRWFGVENESDIEFRYYNGQKLAHHSDGYPEGTVLTYFSSICPPGYLLETSTEKRACNSDGTWSGSPPNCTKEIVKLAETAGNWHDYGFVIWGIVMTLFCAALLIAIIRLHFASRFSLQNPLSVDHIAHLPKGRTNSKPSYPRPAITISQLEQNTSLPSNYTTINEFPAQRETEIYSEITSEVSSSPIYDKVIISKEVSGDDTDDPSPNGNPYEYHELYAAVIPKSIRENTNM